MNNWMTITRPITLEEETRDLLVKAAEVYRVPAPIVEEAASVIESVAEVFHFSEEAKVAAYMVYSNTTAQGVDHRAFIQNGLDHAALKVSNSIKHGFVVRDIAEVKRRLCL